MNNVEFLSAGELYEQLNLLQDQYDRLVYDYSVLKKQNERDQFIIKEFQTFFNREGYTPKDMQAEVSPVREMFGFGGQIQLSENLDMR